MSACYSDLYSFPPCGGHFCLIWVCCSLTAITQSSFSVCVFISNPPRGSCNCSVLMRTAPAQSNHLIPQLQNTRGGAEGGDGKNKKVPGAARQVKHSGQPAPAEPIED
ncbi:hypothetical protein KUCAC02_011337 [Chaenocephalus aceratus]|uniref:Uncharacterized protein n=1 Tax=Chaenocephalus aceratus TaxID=36190 RepID=A0ACB9WVF1_CHAAC|nr:hypothetical protein KUCAC02_011337 [Chaenocephalus aceratus]